MTFRSPAVPEPSYATERSDDIIPVLLGPTRTVVNKTSMRPLGQEVA
jgi:hypothetical protein